jgi:hypothetical protein
MASLISTKEFMELVWPSTGPYCLATPWVTKDGSEVFAHRAYDDIDDAIAGAQGMCFSEKKHVFFCVHALVVARAMNPKTGKMQTRRNHDNMREGKAFFFDLDVGPNEPGKPRKYATAQDAWNGLDRFLFHTALPDPYVVSSGGGLHVYWIIDEPLPSLEWRKAADKLRHIAEGVGLLFDPMRTTDQASVLRVPGTINYKKDIQRKVLVMRVGVVTPTDELIAQFATLAGSAYMPLAPRVGGGVGNMGVEFNGRLTPSEEVFEVCEHMRTFRDNNGVVAEPHYYAGLGLLMHAEDGPALCHAISSGDPRYDEEETQGKMDQWTDKGPPSCAKINLSVGGDACQRCPHAGLGRNPLDIANKVWAAQSVPPTISAALAAAQPKLAKVEVCRVSLPFQTSPTGCGINQQDPQNPNATKVVQFLAYKLFPIEQFEGTASEPGFSRWVVDIPHTGQRTFTIMSSSFLSPPAFMQALLDQMIFVPHANDVTLVRRFMLHYLKDLQNHVQSQAMYDHLGWVYNEEDPALDTGEPVRFVLNTIAYDVNKKGPVDCTMSSHTDFIKAIIKQRGTLQDQIALLDFYNRDSYMPHKFMAMCSLGSPLLRATGEHGLIVAAVGETGTSKSTSIYLGASFWGDYKKYVINGTPEGATVKARDDMIMALQNLPIFIDEVTLLDPTDLRALVMSVNQPGGKIRLTQDSRQRKNRGGLKSTIYGVTSNSSLHQVINTNSVAGQAGTIRVLEVPFDQVALVHTKGEADRFLLGLRQNFGHIGPEFMSKIVPSLSVVDAKLRAEQERIDLKFGIAPHERFYSAGIASALTAGRLAFRLGLHPYDMDQLEEWLGDYLLPKMRDRVKGEQLRTMPHEILANYINAIHGETLVIELDNGGNIGGKFRMPFGALSARYDVSTKEVWLRADRFAEYCTKYGHNANRIVTFCEQNGLIKQITRRTLTKGVPGEETLRSTCYIVDMAHKLAKGLKTT